MYKITFVDNTVFKGGEPNNSKWNEMPQKLIKRIDYKIGDKNIIMEDYEAYNHLVEKYMKIGTCKHIKFDPNLILMGKKGEDIFKIIYNFKSGKITYDVVKLGKEYNNKPTTGWKNGVKSKKKPICKIN